jgi:hypothetical protein
VVTRVNALLSRWTRRLTERDKYEITGWAFSYFMTSHLAVSDAVVEAVRKIKPEKIAKDGSLRLSRHEILELELRVKNLL